MGKGRKSESGGEPEVQRIKLPLTRAKRKELRAGDRLLLTGRILTARDRAHRRLAETLEKGEPLPVELRGEIVYYAGPSPAR